jgi:endonuclease/exonuclease/phosphatase family metal-dependent hydrolase
MKSGTLKIVSFNVLAQAWIDDRLRAEALDSRHLHRGYRIKRQIEILQTSLPDIVLLQEVTPIVIQKYKEMLPEYHVPSCFSRMHWQPARPSDPINGNAVIWRKGLFAGKAKCDIIELDKKLGNYAAMVTGVLAKTNQSIRIISVHLEWGNIDAASKQFRNIFERGYIRNHKRVIIGGDFNMGGGRPDQFPIIADIAHHGLIDHCVGVRTHPFKDESRTITHILTRGFVDTVSGACTILGNCKTIGECLQRYGSDHYPIGIGVLLKD